MKKKKTDRITYFAKNTKTNDKTALLNSLINIVRNSKSGSTNVPENQTDTTYHLTPLLFSTKEDFTSFFSNESKFIAYSNFMLN